MRNIRGVFDDVRTALGENQDITAVLGAIAGAFLATAVERYGADPDPETFAITVDQARASLLSALALVFTGLSIVLALTALTAGTMASKFSPRLLRMKLRGSGNKWILATFALTASFIITSQILLRSSAGDTLAAPMTMSVSVILLIITSISIIWYINGTLQSLRVDRAVRWIAKRIERAVRAHDHALRHDEVVAEIDVERPAGAVDLVAPDHGYVVRVDTDRLAELMAASHGCVVVEAGTGRPVVRDEPIGWISTPSALKQRELDEIRRLRDHHEDERPGKRCRVHDQRPRRHRFDGTVTGGQRPADRRRVHRGLDRDLRRAVAAQARNSDPATRRRHTDRRR